MDQVVTWERNGWRGGALRFASAVPTFKEDAGCEVH